MVVIRRPLIFWLIKAYIKKSSKTIVFSFLLGLCIFFVIVVTSKYLTRIIPVYKKTSIGIVGTYTKENLPPVILNKLSHGLTFVTEDGTVKPDLASGWQELDNGKTYVFTLHKNKYFDDGNNVTSDLINYNFSDVDIKRPDKYTIVFKLKDAYAPFPVTVSKPIFTKGFTGVSDYRVEDIKLNGNFVQTLTIVSTKNRFDMITYQFYPSEDSLKIAFLLGEVTEIDSLVFPEIKDVRFDKDFPNVVVKKIINDSRLVTLFYNTMDGSLSDRKLRLALSYALPNSYEYGQKAFLPYSPESVYYNFNKDITDRTQDFSRAKLLLQSSTEASAGAQIPKTLTITTLHKYRPAAEKIASSWKKLGIAINIIESESIPNNFQIFIGDFTIPKDPDQYILWHSGQMKNITKYKNVRIDKLLEEGRKTQNIEERQKIYADFQKFLFEDVPASFLYFPYEYDVVRK
jgi:ABC-type transport system substrate-binding protein